MRNYREIPSEESQEAQQQQQTVMGLLRDFKRNWEEDRDRSGSGPSQYKKPVFSVGEMESTFLTLDKSLLYVGDNSTFQKRITLILAIQWISFSFMVNTMAFFFRSPSFSCRIPLTDIFYSCSESTACDRSPTDYRVLQSSTESISEEFGLYCGQAGNIYQAESLFLLGGFLSGYFMSYVSEKIGRR